MSRLLRAENLVELVHTGVIQDGDDRCVEGIKYDFRLGPRLLLPGGRPVDVERLSESERMHLLLPAGSLAFVLTQERLRLPNNVKAELSLKRKMSHAGILVLGGFCVDPGYTGRLLFGMFNFSSEAFPIEPGRKLIAAQFYELSENEIPPQVAQLPVDDFPDELVRFMAGYEPSTIASVTAGLLELRGLVDALRQELHSKEEWFKRFQQLLEGHDRAIGKLTDGLVGERDLRNKVEAEFRSELKDVSKAAMKSSLLVGLVTALVVGIVASIVASMAVVHFAK